VVDGGDFAREAVPHLDEGLFSLHGPDADLHDDLTRRPGSFDTVTSAMKAVRAQRSDFGLYVNTVITRRNIDRLPETAALASELGASLTGTGVDCTCAMQISKTVSPSKTGRPVSR